MTTSTNLNIKLQNHPPRNYGLKAGPAPTPAAPAPIYGITYLLFSYPIQMKLQQNQVSYLERALPNK